MIGKLYIVSIEGFDCAMEAAISADTVGRISAGYECGAAVLIEYRNNHAEDTRISRPSLLLVARQSS